MSNSPAPGTAGICRYCTKFALPLAYANTPSAPPTMTDGMIARPSSPSVRFTALLMPTIMKYDSSDERDGAQRHREVLEER